MVYTPRYLTLENIEERRQSPDAGDDDWNREISWSRRMAS
jgi:hypothetical protein